MARVQPESDQAPVVARVRIRYAKRGKMRFTSHRDFARAFERAVERAGVPIAFSRGFTPHPKISYASAAPTGVASEAEYLELGLRETVDLDELIRALDAALSPGLDIVEAVPAGAGALAERINAARWRVELPGVAPAVMRAAVAAFVAATEVPIERLTKQGRRTVDVRTPVVMIWTGEEPSGVDGTPCAILNLVVRQASPTVRPDDVLSGLRTVAALELPGAPKATRLAQGMLTEQGDLLDPLAADRAGTATGASPEVFAAG